MSTEAAAESMLVRSVAAAGGWAPKLVGGGGVPDRLVLHEGRVFLVELKSGTGRLRADQVAWHRAAAAAGVEVVVLKGSPQVRSWLEAQGITPRPTTRSVRDLTN